VLSAQASLFLLYPQFLVFARKKDKLYSRKREKGSSQGDVQQLVHIPSMAADGPKIAAGSVCLCDQNVPPCFRDSIL
jgi:hypothetical protein